MMTPGEMGGPQVSARQGRLESLDVFRGLTIAGMILVNNPGSWSAVYPALEHAEWHGWTPTDLIFPFFLFIIGVATPYSFAGRLDRGATRRSLLGHIVTRSAILFGIGMVLSGIPDYNFYNKLILDVLQRIAVVYLLSAPIILFAGPVAQAVVGIACIVLYWCLMMLVPVPGFGAGVLDPQGNLWQYVDRLLTGGWHDHGEGILSLIPSITTVLLGSLTGLWLRTQRSLSEKAIGMFVAGNAGLLLGVVIDIWFPINKLLWSSSYVVFTAGFALEVLAVCFVVIEMWRLRIAGLPFMPFGTNAIAAFFLSSLTGRLLGLTGWKGPLYNAVFAPWFSPRNASLAYAIAYLLLWSGIMTILYRRKIFFKI